MPVKLHVKKGDTVLVLSGNDKGKTGVVKEAFPRESKVLVEGINMRWKHKKPTQQNPKGERIERETPVHASNVKRVEGTAADKKSKKKAAKKSASSEKS
ncbi:MAG: 50S ribosomal protein L24 [Planctomycetes bacterium]|nr:50S ribosomal protein L24 [Planctomycetota bacterium]